MKKTVLVAGILATALFASVGLTACELGGGNYGETFEGAISSETYTSEQKAAEAFFENEVADGGIEGYNLSYQKGDALTAEEISALRLGDVKAEDVVSAEHGKITYSPAVRARAAQNGQKEVGLIILGFDNGAFRYYVPQPANGEQITKSYLDSVCDLSAYHNFSMSYKMTTSMNGNASYLGHDQIINYSVTVSMELKVAENAAMITLDTSMSGILPAGSDMPASGAGKVTIFVVPEDGLLVAYSSVNYSQFQRNDYAFADYSSLSELLYFEQPDLDYTFFEKTNTGFKLSSDKFDEYAEENFADVFESVKEMMPDIKGEATYFVSDGKLAKATVKLTASAHMSEGGASASMKVGASGSCKYFDFGAAVVTLPEGIPF